MPAATQTRWTLDVSTQVDLDLRDYLENLGKIGPDDMKEFIEQAVQDRIFQEAARRAKEANAGVGEVEIMRAIDESLDWARTSQ